MTSRCHSCHHERGVHARNYADLPVIDLLFGTFHNPSDFAPATGFSDGGSLRVLELLLGRDVAAESGELTTNRPRVDHARLGSAR
jgi:hypothetical protein